MNPDELARIFHNDQNSSATEDEKHVELGNARRAGSLQFVSQLMSGDEQLTDVLTKNGTKNTQQVTDDLLEMAERVHDYVYGPSVKVAPIHFSDPTVQEAYDILSSEVDRDISTEK